MRVVDRWRKFREGGRGEGEEGVGEVGAVLMDALTERVEGVWEGEGEGRGKG